MVSGITCHNDKTWDHQAVEDSLQYRLWIILSDNCDNGNRFVPCGADEHIAAFWAYRDKRRQQIGAEKIGMACWHGVTRSQRAVGA